MPLLQRARRKRLAIFILPGGILTGLLAIYWLVYVPGQKSDLASFYFRSLADAGDRIQSELKELSGPLTNSFKVSVKKESREGILQELKERPIRNLDIIGIDTNRNLDIIHAETNAPLSGADQMHQVVAKITGGELILTFSANDWLVRARCLFNELVDPIARRMDFDDVLILDGSKKVLYQHGGSEVRFRQLALGPEAVDATFQTNWVSQGGLKHKYLLFSQPFRFPYPLEPPSEGGDWIICGIVQPRAFLQQAMALPALAIVLVLGGAVLLLLAWPILDAYCSTYGRMTRWWNVLALHFCATAICALLVFLLLVSGAYQQARFSLNKQVEELAKRILENFREEAGAVHNQLSFFDVQRPLPHTNATRILAPPGALIPEFYEFFSMVFWTDTNGQQTVKWTPEDRNTAFINVGKRVYHRAVANGQHWIWEGATQKRFYLEPIYSWNSAENLAVWTIPSMNETNAIAAMVVKFRSLLGPILPLDYGFCVVDETGQVLFHSDEERNLRENFFTESSAGTALRAAVWGRQQASFNCRYLGQWHRVFVTPMPSLPWSLITFRNERHLQTMTFQALWLGVCVYTASLGLAAIGLLMGGWWVGRQWFYPNARRARGYVWLTWINASAGIALLIWAESGGHGDFWLLVAGLLPLGSIGLAAGVLRRTGSSMNLGADMVRRLYTLALASVLFMTAIVPAFLISRVFSQSELELIAQRTQFTLARQMAERERRIQEEGRRLNLTSDVHASRFSNQWDLHVSALFASPITHTNNEEPGADRETALHWITQSIGLPKAMRLDKFGDANWTWLIAKDDRLALSTHARNLPGGGHSAGIRIESELPPVWPVGVAKNLTLAVAVGFVMALPLAWLVSRTIFVFEIPRIAAESHPLKVVFAPCWAVREPWASWPRRRWERNVGDESSVISNPHQVVVEDFGEKSEDAEATEQKLNYLLGLLSDPDREVILLTKAHPLNFALNSDASEAFEAKMLRWVQLFRNCDYVYPVDDLQPGSSGKEFLRVWAACSPTERKALYNIATSNLADPKSPDLGELQKRNLIQLNPMLEITNSGFRDWVARNYREQPSLRHLRRAEGGWWTRNKRTVFWFLVVSGLFFFLTQQMALDSMVSIIAGFTTALVALAKVTQLISETRQSAKV